jgi:CDP-glycerol glycerophosphotransferase (TagB/SpsB family)
LRDNLDRFRELTALVVPEKTSLMLKTRFGLDHLRMVHTRHGAGDRAIGFDRASGLFDYVLVSGRKIRDRLAQAGLLRPDGHAIVGYPKFDLLAQRPAPPKPFDNGRPTILYNPHPSPRLSSWYRMGPQILDHFRRSDRYNLIFAPHVMLFARKWTLSLDPPAIARVGKIDKAVAECPHILVDTGSAASIDMSHALAADIYLGDASSQIYEFLVKPRPCIFMNAQRHAWRGNPDFAHWEAGPVIESVAELDTALASAVDQPARYSAIQRRMFAHTFDLNETPSSHRAAHALSQWLDRVAGRGSEAENKACAEPVQARRA